MRTRNVVLVLAMLLALSSGCLESVTPDQVDVLTGSVQEVMLAIDNVQVALAESEVLDKERVEAFSASTDKVQEVVATITTAIEESKDKPLLGRVEDVVEAAKPFNPYAAETQIALLIATGVAGLFAKHKNSQAKEAEAERKTSRGKELDALAEALVFKRKYQAHKVGAELTMRQLATNIEGSEALVVSVPKVKELMYRNVGEARARNGITLT